MNNCIRCGEKSSNVKWSVKFCVKCLEDFKLDLDGYDRNWLNEEINKDGKMRVHTEDEDIFWYGR